MYLEAEFCVVDFAAGLDKFGEPDAEDVGGEEGVWRPCSRIAGESMVLSGWRYEV